MSEITSKLVPLGKNLYTQVDEEDYDNVMKYNWRKLNDYSRTKIGKKEVYLHYFILGRPPKDHIIDHKDGDKLNNTRKNLRFATLAQNSQNKAKLEGCTSQYKGVIWHSIAKKWVTWSSTTYLGSFTDETEAAIKYDTYTFLKYGEDSRTNNLVKFEDIKDIDINTLLCKINRELPKYIYPKRTAFDVQITYKKQLFRSSQPTMEKALQKLEEYQFQIEIIKNNNDYDHNAQDIVRNEEGIAIIPIVNTHGHVIDHSTVSDDKWYLCMKYSWYKSHGYAASFVDGKQTRLNRFISGAPKDTVADHIDNNKMNNTNENLRSTNHGVNNHNRTKKKNASSQYFGVCYNKKGNVWTSEIRKDNKKYYIGRFKVEIEAAKAYNIKATELYGNCAKLNVF